MIDADSGSIEPRRAAGLPAGVACADFYGLPRASETVTLHRQAWTLPAEFMAGDDEIVPLGGGEPVSWKLA